MLDLENINKYYTINLNNEKNEIKKLEEVYEKINVNNKEQN